MPSHKDATNADMHKIGITASADPGAVGAGVVWHDTDTNEVWVRNAANSAWVELTGGASGAVASDTIWDAKGDLAGGTGANTAQKLTVGANDTILMADSGQTTGLKWVAAGTPAAIDASGGAGSADTFARGDHTHVHEAAHIAHDTAWAAKGDIVAGTADNTAAVLTAGANDTILMADAAQSTGLKWVASATPVAVGTANDAGTSDDFARGSHVHAHEAAHLVHDTGWAAKGDLIVGTANDTAAILTKGTDTHVLTADSAEATGLKWAAPSGGALTDHTHEVTGSGATGGGGTVKPATLLIPATATPAQTADGEAKWDTTLDILTIGDGTTRKQFMRRGSSTPTPAAFGDTGSATVGTSYEGAIYDHRHAMPADPVTAHVAASDPHTGYLLESLLDAKGDIIAASAADTPARLPVGTNGHVLTADSAEATGIKWAAAGAGALTDHTHAVTGSGATGGGGTLSPAILNIPAEATPAQTAEGEARWDNDGDVLTIGTGAATFDFGPLDTGAPTTQALGDAASAGTARRSAHRDHKHAMPAAAVTSSGLTVSATDRILGRDTAGSGAVEELTVAAVMAMNPSPTINVYTSGSGSWSKPAGARIVRVRVVGGGGGGGGCAATVASERAVGGGGGGGGYVEKTFAASALGSTESYAVGAAANGGTAGNNNGTAGNNSTFGSGGTLLTGSGGAAGDGSAASSGAAMRNKGGAGGAASGGDLNVPGSAGEDGMVSGSNSTPGGRGGATVLGSTTLIVTPPAAGVNGAAYGSGGSGAAQTASQSARAGGNGSAGVIIVETWP